VPADSADRSVAGSLREERSSRQKSHLGILRRLCPGATGRWLTVLAPALALALALALVLALTLLRRAHAPAYSAVFPDPSSRVERADTSRGLCRAEIFKSERVYGRAWLCGSASSYSSLTLLVVDLTLSEQFILTSDWDRLGTAPLDQALPSTALVLPAEVSVRVSSLASRTRKSITESSACTRTTDLLIESIHHITGPAIPPSLFHSAFCDLSLFAAELILQSFANSPTSPTPPTCSSEHQHAPRRGSNNPAMSSPGGRSPPSNSSRTSHHGPTS
jgi:hypothetical protein